MKRILRLHLLLLLCVSPAWSLGLPTFMPGPHKPPAGQALVRCDPGLIVQTIDGEKYRSPNNGGGSDCAILLAPGEHRFGVWVQWNYSDGLRDVWERTPGTFDFPFQVSADRIYRVKYQYGDPDSYWLADVTAEEADLGFHKFVGKSPNRKLPAGERTSFVVLRVQPPDVALIGALGSTYGIWFLVHRRLILQPKDGTEFVVKELPAGSNLSLAHAVTEGESWGTGTRRAIVCGDTRYQLFENLPGGKVFFLGTYRFKPTRLGMELSVDAKDLAPAAEYFRAKHPEVSGTLEPAPSRVARVRAPCRPGTFEQLSITPQP